METYPDWEFKSQRGEEEEDPVWDFKKKTVGGKGNSLLKLELEGEQSTNLISV